MSLKELYLKRLEKCSDGLNPVDVFLDRDTYYRMHFEFVNRVIDRGEDVVNVVKDLLKRCENDVDVVTLVAIICEVWTKASMYEEDGEDEFVGC